MMTDKGVRENANAEAHMYTILGIAGAAFLAVFIYSVISGGLVVLLPFAIIGAAYCFYMMIQRIIRHLLLKKEKEK